MPVSSFLAVASKHVSAICTLGISLLGSIILNLLSSVIYYHFDFAVWGLATYKQLFYGVPEDIENWMELAGQISWNFPGLETQEKMNEHITTVLKFMDER